MIKEIAPGGPVRGRVRVPGSKSYTNRALICAALAQGASTLLNASDSNDSERMGIGLNQLGVLVRPSGNGTLVEGTGGRLDAPKFPIKVGNAGTTFRFLLSLATLAKGTVVLEGSERMGQRPVDDLLRGIESLGGVVKAFPEQVRFEVQGGSLAGGHVVLRADKSSQFLSSLLMVAPYAAKDVRIDIEGEVSSASYLAMTLEVMGAFGVEVERPGEGTLCVRAGRRYRPTDYAVETDASGATYPFGAAAVTGGEVVVEGLSGASGQGDIGFLDVLKHMGCTVESVAGGVKVCGARKLKGVDVDMNSMPDAVPTVAVLALFAESPSRIRNVGHLQYKESDRLRAIAGELEKLGARIELLDDGIAVTPAPLKGALLDTFDDHRLVMSFSLIGLRVPGVRIENPECVRKSFPGYWDEFAKLRAGI